MEYRTVAKLNSDEYVVKHSRFIGYAKPVSAKEEAESFIAEIKAKHWDAKHNVYAYILREGNIKRYSDDGEPQGTAGVPVLDVLEKENVTDICVVVTRYFGGILLGGGGLVRAYSHSAKIALDAAGIITKALCLDIKLSCDYSTYGKLETLLRNENAKIVDTDFADNVDLVFCIRKDNYDSVSKKITELSNGKLVPEICGEKFEEI